MRVVDRQTVLVRSDDATLQLCDHETGQWRTTETLHSPDGRVVTGLSAGHTYSFRLGDRCACVTIPHETRWQQEQFERRYQQLHVIGESVPN